MSEYMQVLHTDTLETAHVSLAILSWSAIPQQKEIPHSMQRTRKYLWKKSSTWNGSLNIGVILRSGEGTV